MYRSCECARLARTPAARAVRRSAGRGVLRTRGIAALVLDGDPSARARDQGGTLDLREDSGQRALAAAGLLDAFRVIARAEGEELRIFDKTGALRLHERPEDATGTRPEVDRGALRDVLLASLPPDTVRWGAKVTSLGRSAAGRPALTLATGAVVESDLVVGADGAWSKIRSLVSDARPVYSGLSFVEATLSDVDWRHPAAAALVGRGSMFALADGKGLIAQRNGGGRIRLYIALQVPEDWVTSDAVVAGDPSAAKRRLLEFFGDWDRRLRALVVESDAVLVPRPIYALPVGHRWDRTPGVTLLGDAAHLMSPFAGEGANLAMLDGAELARARADHGDLETALGVYEAALFPRAEAAAARSAENLVDAFRPDAPQGMLDQMARYGGDTPVARDTGNVSAATRR